MKSTGIVRRVDELGRVVLPIELRNKFNIAVRDPVEIYVDGSAIILKKLEITCIFCGNPEDLTGYEDKMVCKDCLREIQKITIKD